MTTSYSRRWGIALALVILTSYVHLLPNSSSAANAPETLFRNVLPNSAVLVLISQDDNKLCLRLTNSKGLALLSPVSHSQASTELLKFVEGVWGGSMDGSNVRAFNIRGASPNTNQKETTQAKPVVFNLTGYLNSKWVLTVVPLERLNRSAKPSDKSPSRYGDGFESAPVSVVWNGGECGRGMLGSVCDPLDDCDSPINVEFIPGINLPLLPANATAIHGAGGDTLYATCIY